MNVLSLSIDQIKNSLTPVFLNYDIKLAILFGSVARGDPSKHSDVDLILVKETHQRFLKRYEGIFTDLHRLLPGIAVDVLIYTPDEFQRMKSTAFMVQVLAKGIIIHEHD
jgi:uncharacterized protein